MVKKIVNPRVYAALYLRSKSASEKIIMTNDIVTKMTENVGVFPNPEPTLAEVTAASVQLSIVASAAENGSVYNKLDLAQKENALDTLITRLKNYAQNVANKDNDSMIAANILVSGGFTLSKTKGKNPVPQPVSDLVAIFTNQVGKILVKWKTAKYARANQVFVTTTPEDEASWKFAGSTTRRKLMVEKLASNTRYYFRVVSVGSRGTSSPSMYVNNITNMN